MNRFVRAFAVALAPVLMPSMSGCAGSDCSDQTDHSEDSSGQLTTPAGAFTLTYEEAANPSETGALIPVLCFLSPTSTHYPSLSFDFPSVSGTYSLPMLHATVCTSPQDACSTAEGVLVYTLRPDLADDEFDAEVSFFATPSGDDARVTGWAEVNATSTTEQVCTGGAAWQEI